MQTYVYHTIDPGLVSSIGDRICRALFGMPMDTNDNYSFAVNDAVGHFSFRINRSLINPGATPQDEGEAIAKMNECVAGLRQRLAKAAANDARIPNLFNSSYMRMLGISPIHSGELDAVIAWRALYGIDLTVVPSGDAGSQKALLEGESIIIELSGTSVVAIDYGHVPILSRKELPLADGVSAAFAYRRVNRTTLAPYYLTADGYMPACSESIAVRTRPVSAGWGDVKKGGGTSGCKSMITLSNVVHPNDELKRPGSANIVIAMDYRVVTAGEGAVTNLGFTDPMKFSKIFSRGDINGLDLRTLPSVDRPPRGLDLGELEQCNEIDPETGGPCFWDYYEVNVKYEFSLDVKEGLSIIEGLTWVSECPDSRGLIVISPFAETLDKWYQADSTTIADLRTEQPNKTDEGLKEYRQAKITHASNNHRTCFFVQFIEAIISANSADFTNKNIFIEKGHTIIRYGDVFSNEELLNFVASLGSILHREKIEVENNKSWVEIEGHDSVMNAIYFFAKESLIAYSKMQNDTGNKITSGVGSVGLLNYVFLNPKLFEGSPSAISFESISMLPEEILAHEAGHNAADEFHHRHTKEGPYEYHQDGLQSEKSGKIFPTVRNTIGILEDENNRKNMRIE